MKGWFTLLRHGGQSQDGGDDKKCKRKAAGPDTQEGDKRCIKYSNGQGQPDRSCGNQKTARDRGKREEERHFSFYLDFYMGIIGNETADVLAKQAAEGVPLGDYEAQGNG